MSIDKSPKSPNIRLDITTEKCPMTFVKTRLLLEKTAPGEFVEIVLSDGEAKENVPQSVKDLGHEVESLDPINEGETFLMTVRVV